jgi:hypothetical protein
MAAKKSNPKTDVVTLKVKATIEVQFNSYGDELLNKKAKEQIAIWVEETLKEEEQVPLFVSTQAGEESISKTIKVDIDG